MTKKEKYKLRTVIKSDKGSLKYRIELWQFHTGWIDALQPSFDDKEAAQRHMKLMNDEPIQETLL